MGHFWGYFWTFWKMVIFGSFLGFSTKNSRKSGSRHLVKIRGGSYFDFSPFFGFQYETHEWEHPGYPPGGHFRGRFFGGFLGVFWPFFTKNRLKLVKKGNFEKWIKKVQKSIIIEKWEKRVIFIFSKKRAKIDNFAKMKTKVRNLKKRREKRREKKKTEHTNIAHTANFEVSKYSRHVVLCKNSHTTNDTNNHYGS